LPSIRQTRKNQNFKHILEGKKDLDTEEAHIAEEFSIIQWREIWPCIPSFVKFSTQPRAMIAVVGPRTRGSTMYCRFEISSNHIKIYIKITSDPSLKSPLNEFQGNHSMILGFPVLFIRSKVHPSLFVTHWDVRQLPVQACL